MTNPCLLCKWYEHTHCGHDRAKTESPITGMPGIWKIDFFRSIPRPDFCGPDGQFFEPKPKERGGM